MIPMIGMYIPDVFHGIGFVCGQMIDILVREYYDNRISNFLGLSYTSRVQH